MVLLLCIVIVATAAYLLYEITEWARRVWQLGPREDWDVTSLIRHFWKGR